MRFYYLILICLSLLFNCETKQEKVSSSYLTKEYSVLFGDKEAGFFTSSKTEDGVYNFVMEYNDRGRGPHIEESIVMDEDNHLSHLEITGINYLKDSVSEVFDATKKTASWEGNTESGQVDISNGAFFTAVNSTLGNTELLINILLNEEDRTVELLPSGTAKINMEETVKINDSLTLRLIELGGLSFAPEYYWLDDSNRVFAMVSDWLSIIPKDHKDLMQPLLEIQTKKTKQYYADLAEKITAKPTDKWAITNAMIFNSLDGTLSGPKSVIIDGNKIYKIVEGTDDLGEITRSIDANGQTLLPGLFDMHTHGDRNDGLLHIAAGVTSVRDMANSLDFPEIKDEFNNNSLIGPRVLVMSGFIDKAGPYAGPTGKIVESLEEGLEAVEYYSKNGYQQIKLYSSIEPEWVKPLADRAHELDMRVSGHIPSFMLARDAVESGYDEIQHINMVALNFMSDSIDTRTPLRFSMIGKHAVEIDVQGEEFTEFAQFLKNKNIVVDATVSIFEQLLAQKPGAPNPEIASIIERLPIQVKRSNYSGGLPIPEGMENRYKDSFQNLLNMVKRLHELGVTVVPGTDAMAGFALHTELENYVRAGIKVEDVLKMVTMDCAKVIGIEDSLGSIEEGKLADMILVNGNPLENISDIRNVILTVKDGNLYDTSKIYETLGVEVTNN